MAIFMGHFASGPTLIKWGTAGSEVTYGYSRNGVPYQIEPKWIDVPSDARGGESGVPADVQIVGGLAVINIELTHYNVDDSPTPDRPHPEDFSSFVKGGTAGAFPEYGTFIRQENKYGQLVLQARNETMKFPVAFLRFSFGSNHATRYKSFFCGWECQVDADTTRVLYTRSAGVP